MVHFTAQCAEPDRISAGPPRDGGLSRTGEGRAVEIDLIADMLGKKYHRVALCPPGGGAGCRTKMCPRNGGEFDRPWIWWMEFPLGNSRQVVWNTFSHPFDPMRADWI